MNLDRARGTLWGQAAGDAVGTTREFSRPRQLLPFPQLNLGPQTDLVGGGPFSVRPGQVTDDTQMAVCLAESLCDRGGYDAADAAQRYVSWSKVAFDIGHQTSSALRLVSRGSSPIETGRDAWEAAGRRPAANGSLMRCSPIAVYFASDRERLRRASLEDAAITHFDPKCRLACAVFNAAIASAISDEADRVQMWARAKDELAPAAAALEAEGKTPPELIAAAREIVAEDLALAAQDDPRLTGPEVDLWQHAGFVRVALRLAFWHLLHAPSFEAAILDCTNRGGDSDTNGAIAGALFGAHAGEAGIPASWREKVARALEGESGPWADLYHPRRLFRLVENRQQGADRGK